MKELKNNNGKILIYQNEKGDTKIDVFFQNNDIWLTQKALMELYQVSKGSISEHIMNIFEDGELSEEATVRKFRTVQREGGRDVTRELTHYNFQMVLAIGYRVRSRIGMHFRHIQTGYIKEGTIQKRIAL